MAAIRVGKQGRIVLPAEIRRQLDIKEGDRLGVVVDGEGRVVMESPDAALKKVRQKLNAEMGDRSLVDEYLAEKRVEVGKEEREFNRRLGDSWRSALLAVLKAESGTEAVEPRLERAVISSVNWLEVIQTMIPFEVAHETLRQSLPEVEVAAFDEPHAAIAAAMRDPTRHLGASLADRACLALALFREAPVLTADRKWATTVRGYVRSPFPAMTPPA